MATKLEILLSAATGNTSAQLNKIKGDLQGVEKSGSSLHNTLGKLSSVAIGVGASAVALGVKAIDMADAFEKAHATLVNTVKNVGQNFDEFKGKVAATDKAMESLGFTNADTENALARLTVATKNVTTSTQLMGLAADIARARNIDLQSATDILVKVEGGRFTQLGRLGILSKQQVTDLGKEKDATQATKDAVQILTNLYGGAAAANSQTFAGKMQVLSARAQDLGKDIGLALIPIVEGLAGAALKVVGALQSANDATGGFLGQMAKIGGIGAAVVLGTSAVINALVTMGAAAVTAGETLLFFAAMNPEVAGLLALGAAAVFVTQGFNDAHTSAEDAFTSMQKLSTLQLQTVFVPLSGSFADMAREAGIVQDHFDKLLNSGSATAAELTSYIVAAKAAGIDTRGMSAALNDFVAKQQAAAASAAAYNALTDATATSSADAGGAAADLKTKQDALKAAYDAANKFIGDQYDALNKNVSGFLYVFLAQIADRKAVDDYAKSTKDAKLSTDEHTASLLNTEKQLFDTAAETADATTANQHFAGAAQEAAAKSQVQISYLQGVANTLAPGSALRAGIEGYIAKLQGIPVAVNTLVNANTAAASAAIQDIINKIANVPFERTIRFTVVGGGYPMKAGGGYVSAAALGGFKSNMVLVGEKGPGSSSLPTGSFVHTAAQTQAMLGGSPFNNAITGFPGAPPVRPFDNRITGFPGAPAAHPKVAAGLALPPPGPIWGSGSDLSTYRYRATAEGVFNPAGLPGNPAYHGLPEVKTPTPTVINVNIDARGSIEANWDKAGRSIVDALKKYQNANGALPVVVAGARAIRA